MRKPRHMSELILSTIAALICITLSQSAAAATCNTAEARMAEIINLTKTTDTLVLAHRGYWGKYNHDANNVPENSGEAVYWANLNCMDGVELDVKESADGVLFLMHDFTLGRTTNAYAVLGGTQYDPMTNNGTNPQVASVNAATIDMMKLLTPDRSTITGSIPLRVQSFLQAWIFNRYQIPLVFDVKTTSAVKTLDSQAFSINRESLKVWGVKVNATLYPDPAAFYRDAYNLQVIPVYTTNMLGVISVATSLHQWQGASKTIEINVKQNNGLLWFQKKQVIDAGQKAAVFHAIPDGPIQNSFYKNTGQCCYKLSDYYYTYTVNGQIAGQDTDDQRGDIQFLNAQGFGLLTSDDPNHDVEVLALLGKRRDHFQYYAH